MTTTIPVRLTVNGRERAIDVAPNHTLLDVLRNDLGLTGTTLARFGFRLRRPGFVPAAQEVEIGRLSLQP